MKLAKNLVFMSIDSSTACTGLSFYFPFLYGHALGLNMVTLSLNNQLKQNEDSLQTK